MNIPVKPSRHMKNKKKARNYMTENNEIKELKYTEEQVMKALMQMTPEQRQILYGNSIQNLMEIANSEEYAQRAIDYYTQQADAYAVAVNLIKEFVTALHNQNNSTENVIESMAEIYKGMSREERLQFSEMIAKEGDLDNSLDMLKSTWRKFLSHLA